MVAQGRRQARKKTSNEQARATPQPRNNQGKFEFNSKSLDSPLGNLAPDLDFSSGNLAPEGSNAILDAVGVCKGTSGALNLAFFEGLGCIILCNCNGSDLLSKWWLVV